MALPVVVEPIPEVGYSNNIIGFDEKKHGHVAHI
jgi:hypothetical protein